MESFLSRARAVLDFNRFYYYIRHDHNYFVFVKIISALI